MAVGDRGGVGVSLGVLVLHEAMKAATVSGRGCWTRASSHRDGGRIRGPSAPPLPAGWSRSGQRRPNGSLAAVECAWPPSAAGCGSSPGDRSEHSPPRPGGRPAGWTLAPGVLRSELQDAGLVEGPISTVSDSAAQLQKEIVARLPPVHRPPDRPRRVGQRKAGLGVRLDLPGAPGRWLRGDNQPGDPGHRHARRPDHGDRRMAEGGELIDDERGPSVADCLRLPIRQTTRVIGRRVHPRRLPRGGQRGGAMLPLTRIPSTPPIDGRNVRSGGRRQTSRRPRSTI